MCLSLWGESFQYEYFKSLKPHLCSPLILKCKFANITSNTNKKNLKMLYRHCSSLQNQKFPCTLLNDLMIPFHTQLLLWKAPWTDYTSLNHHDFAFYLDYKVSQFLLVHHISTCNLMKHKFPPILFLVHREIELVCIYATKGSKSKESLQVSNIPGSKQNRPDILNYRIGIKPSRPKFQFPQSISQHKI